MSGAHGEAWPDRVAALAGAHLRARLADDSQQADLSGPLAPRDPARMFLLPPGPARYDVRPENSLAAEAARRGTTPAGTRSSPSR